jgi:hypothetical protein
MSPPRRNLPDTTSSLVALLPGLIRQYGVGIFFAFIFALAVARVYHDLERRTEVLIDLVVKQTMAAEHVSSLLEELLREVRK